MKIQPFIKLFILVGLLLIYSKLGAQKKYYVSNPCSFYIIVIFKFFNIVYLRIIKNLKKTYSRQEYC